MTTLAVKGNPLGTGNMTLVSPDSNLSQTLTLPDSTGNVVVDVSTQTLTNKTLGSGTVTATSLITSGTAQASTSGVAIDFTGIPSWVKRITVMFNGVSTNGTSNLLIQIGTSSGVTTSGYTSCAGTTLYTTGFGLAFALAANSISGQINITNISGNIWVGSHVLSNVAAGGGTSTGGGNITLSSTLDRVRITTVGGTDAFDAGSINIMYE